MFNKLAVESLYFSLTKIFDSKKENHMIIEPLSCLIKLSLLNFYPSGTKLNVNDNQLLFNEPTMYQGVIRYFYNQGREDLHNLFNPIDKAIEWYTEYNEDIDVIFELAINGLIKLRNTYAESSTIKHTLNYYINKLQERNKKSVITGKKLDKIQEYLQNLWNDREIHIIVEILQELEDKNSNDTIKQDDITSLLDSLFSITNNKEQKVKIFLDNYVSIL